MSRRSLAIALSLALALGVFLVRERQLAGGSGFPLDDAWIHFHFARNLAEGHGFVYNPGVHVSGSTAPLWTLLLGGTFALAGSEPLLAKALGVVLPSNSPGVHGLWIPAISMKMPLVLRPGGTEPWTPFRLIQALMKAGVPGDAFNYFPSDHAGAGEIARRTGRSMFFGDVGAVGSVAGDPRVELHGPGYSKLLFGADLAPLWRDYLDVMALSVAENGGRSCVNASGVWTPAHGRELALEPAQLAGRGLLRLLGHGERLAKRAAAGEAKRRERGRFM